jgi:hypothetical protein
MNNGQCNFNDERVSYPCDMLAAADSEYCARHAFLVAQFGLDKARDIELGVVCVMCGCLFDKPGQVARCKTCETKKVCLSCRLDEVCCFNAEAKASANA